MTASVRISQLLGLSLFIIFLSEFLYHTTEQDLVLCLFYAKAFLKVLHRKKVQLHRNLILSLPCFKSLTHSL